MTHRNLHNLLKRLHIEIDNTKTDDETKQRTLDEMKFHVQKVLDDPEGGHHEPLRERLEDSVALFEVEHPSLTGAIQAVNLSLSSAGM